MGRKALYTKIYNQLRYQILSGELAIGSPLPPERKLAMQLGVSRNTIVRAYAELEAEGIIASRMGSGRYVEALTPASAPARIDWHYHTLGTLAPAPSHMAELLGVTDKYPDIINFAHGDGGKHTLESSGFPDYVKSTAEQLHSYYFTSVQGLPELREHLVSWMDMEQISSPEQVVITSGSQEGLYLIASLLARPGDLVLTEMPTYFGSLQLFQSLGMQVVPVPMDADGLRVDVLERDLEPLPAAISLHRPNLPQPDRMDDVGHPAQATAGFERKIRASHRGGRCLPSPPSRQRTPARLKSAGSFGPCRIFEHVLEAALPRTADRMGGGQPQIGPTAHPDEGAVYHYKYAGPARSGCIPAKRRSTAASGKRSLAIQ